MSRKRKNQFALSALQNSMSYTDYLYKFLELAISRFKWNGLPESVDERFLELTLITDGQAIYFNDDVMGNLVLQVTANGPLDVYRIPIERRAYAVNGYQKILNKENSVLIYNNMLRTNIFPLIEKYATLLYDFDRAIAVNVHAQKTPMLITGTEQQRLTLLNLYKQYDGNEPVIFGGSDLDLNGIGAINTSAPYVSDKLYELKVKYYNEGLTALGIANISQAKKERLISDEVHRSMGGTLAMRQSSLMARKQAAEKINAMFGTEISVEFRDNEPDETTNYKEEKGEELDEQIYNRN